MFLRSFFAQDNIFSAIEKGKLSTVKKIISKGTDADTINDGLILAVFHGKEKIADCLINHGADVNCQKGNGYTPLHWALGRSKKYTSPEVIRLLISKGANVNKSTFDGYTALMLAVGIGNGEIIKMLLEQGADVDAANSKGETALTLARKPEVAKLLREYGTKTAISTQLRKDTDPGGKGAGQDSAAEKEKS